MVPGTIKVTILPKPVWGVVFFSGVLEHKHKVTNENKNENNKLWK